MRRLLCYTGPTIAPGGIALDQNRLLVLGLLKTQEQHGYQLMDFVERNLGCITNLKKATAYYELKRLQEQHLVSVRQEQEGGRPPRQVYSLTPDGEQAFLDLLTASLRLAEPATSTADVGLMFMDWLPPREVRALIEEKLVALRGRLELYRATPSHGEDSSVDLAIDHAAARLESEIAWFEGLVQRLKERPARSPAAGRKARAATLRAVAARPEVGRR